MPRGTPTTAISIRVPNDLLAWIDGDLVVRDKASRQQWFVDLATKRRSEQRAYDEQAARRPVKPYPKR